MIGSTPQSAALSARAMLRLRCADLNLPACGVEGDGVDRKVTMHDPVLSSWADETRLEELVRSAAAQWDTQETPEIIEPAPGLWLLPLIENERRRRLGYLVAIGATPEALRSLCKGDATPPIEPAICASRDEAVRLLRALALTQQDLERLSRGADEVSAFSRQLAESYEEVSLLLRLGRSMNRVDNPQLVVTRTCDELRHTMLYRWIAVRFVPDKSQVRSMAGRLFVSGELPCNTAVFGAETARLLNSLEGAESRVMQPDDHLMHSGVSTPIVVQSITRGGSVVGVLMAGQRVTEAEDFSSVDLKMIEAAAGCLSVLLDNSLLYEDQQSMFVGTLEALTAAIDAKDPYTCGHSHRVAELAAALARAHGLDDAAVDRVRMAGIVHDVGKIGVPEAVLCKTGRLTDEEFMLIKQHPEIGYQILKDIPQFGDLLPGVLSHHERFDGRGYPQGLRGEEIPLMARIIGLVDSFDAMSSNRTYRSAMARGRVYEELADHAGTQFDPDLVRSFAKVDLSVYDELVELHQIETIDGGLRIRRKKAA